MVDDAPLDATPDELLLELMDLVTLAFPEALTSMTIEFREADDRKRPALTNLDGRADDRVPRPDLGHSDNQVLDAINSLLVDFSEATRKQGNVRVLTGKIEIEPGDDGSRDVALVDTSGAEPVVRMTRRFDASELRWLFWTAPLFRALASTAARETEQRERLDVELRAYRAFQIDMVKGEIAFMTERGGPTAATYAFELLGSWSDDDKRFLWGFANDQVAPQLKHIVETQRASSTEAGLRALSEASFGCPEPCAERLARHAAAKANALGVYRAPFKSAQAKGSMYLALLEAKATARR
jgi:hypothetical protein